MDRGAGQATIHGIARVEHDLVTTPPPYINVELYHYGNIDIPFIFNTIYF